MDFVQAKSFLASKTVWGAVVAVLATALGMIGFSVTPADQAQALDIVDQILAQWDRLAAIAGAGLALYGRVVATKRIG